MNKETFKDKLEKIDEFCDEHFSTMLVGIAAVGYLSTCVITKRYCKRTEDNYNKALIAQLLMNKCSESK